MGLGAVSFVHVVKAAEPVFAAVLSAIFAGAHMSLQPGLAGSNSLHSQGQDAKCLADYV
jgi:hypothetical protein